MRSVHWLDTQLESWPEVFERRKDEALRAVAVLEARLGRLDRARKHFDRIERPFHRAAAATYVARVLAEKK